MCLCGVLSNIHNNLRSAESQRQVAPFEFNQEELFMLCVYVGVGVFTVHKVVLPVHRFCHGYKRNALSQSCVVPIIVRDALFSAGPPTVDINRNGAYRQNDEVMRVSPWQTSLEL